ncbi:hypothetical protein HDU85_003822 [Gaertneriomyces sp. JEL0708]|nr:hypothetical protein HDU85_003822 [Gaertneriomyces sp. JEL0708]
MPPETVANPNGAACQNSEFIFLGTGTSGSVPNIFCLTAEKPTCQVCQAAIRLEPSRDVNDSIPVFNKNKRRNTSGVYRYMHSDGRMRNILIDVGKTFYESALTWFVHHRLRRIDAVLLTHGHADAMMGMDDLRHWTIGGASYSVQDYVDVYCNRRTMDVVQSAFPYICDTGKATGGGEVPSTKFHILDDMANGVQTFRIEELEVTAFDVEHGKDTDGSPFMSLGFKIGDFVYISDANRIPSSAKRLIEGSTQTLVIDALHYTGHASHFSIEQSIVESLDIVRRGGTCFFTGFSHRVDHDKLEDELKNDNRLQSAGIRILPAYDGLKITL